MNAMKEFDELEAQLNNKGHQQEETKSLKDMLREKRENTEHMLSTKQSSAPQ